MNIIAAARMSDELSRTVYIQIEHIVEFDFRADNSCFLLTSAGEEYEYRGDGGKLRNLVLKDILFT